MPGTGNAVVSMPSESLQASGQSDWQTLGRQGVQALGVHKKGPQLGLVAHFHNRGAQLCGTWGCSLYEGCAGLPLRSGVYIGEDRKGGTYHLVLTSERSLLLC